MDDQQAKAIVDFAKAAIAEPCFASVTPRQLRLTHGEWLRLGSVWTADNTKACEVWYHPETDDGWLWPLVVPKDGVVPPEV